MRKTETSIRRDGNTEPAGRPPWTDKDGHFQLSFPAVMLAWSVEKLFRVGVLPLGRLPAERGAAKKAILAALAEVDYWEDRATGRPVDVHTPGARSVGLSYRDIQKHVQAKHPDIRVSMMTIRTYARDAKEAGQVLPGRRPYSQRRRRTAP